MPIGIQVIINEIDLIDESTRIVQGTDWSRVIVIEGVDENGNPYPINLNTYDVALPTCQFRTPYFREDGTAHPTPDVTTKCPAVTCAWVNAGNAGEIALSIVRAQTEKGGVNDNPVGTIERYGVYDVRITNDTTGEKQYVARGRWKIDEERTRT